MKKIQLLLLFVAFTGIAAAQADLQAICNSLENAQVFVNYRNFKNDFEQMNKALGNQSNLTYQEYEELHYAYNDTRKRYNEFLGGVKRDLSTFQTIKIMAGNEAEAKNYAKKYVEDYRKVIDEYEKNYLPVYQRLSAKGKSIPPALILASFEAFVMVIDFIKHRKELREEHLNAILGVVNTFFYNKLEMKSWDNLEIRFNGTAGTGGEGVPPRPLPVSVTEPIDIAPPIFSDMSGYIEFKYLDAKQQPENMGFAKSGGKDLGVEVLISPTKVETVPIYTHYFSSTQAYGEGTQFMMKVNNSAGMYIFALNSDNDIKFLYPYENDKVTCGKASKGNGLISSNNAKDLDVLPATPVVGQDIDGNTVLPTQDCSVVPPVNRYFTIRGAGTSENFCVLLTKSELDPKDLARRLEAESGSLNERLTKVFSNQIISPRDAIVSIENNRVNFNADAAQNSVMPLVFVIKRK